MRASTGPIACSAPGAYPPPADASPIVGLEVAGPHRGVRRRRDAMEDRRRSVRADAGRRLRRVLHDACGLLPAAAPGTVDARGGVRARDLLHRLVQPLRAHPLRRRRIRADPWRHERHRPHRDPAVQGFGATVFTTAGSDDKVAFCRAMGADHALNYKTQDWAAERGKLTGKKGVERRARHGRRRLRARRTCARSPATAACRRSRSSKAARRDRHAPHHDEAADRHRLDAPRESCPRARSRSRRRCAKRSGRSSARAS